jgi:predicted NBD/HSP70 family sugar kinase
MTVSSGGKPTSLKRKNRKLILELFRHEAPLSVTEISERISLSIVTVWKVIDHYLSIGIIVPAGKGASTDEGGKKPSLFQFNSAFAFAIGIHLFPDELYCAITDLSAQVLHSVSVPIREDESLDRLLGLMSTSIKSLLASAGADSGSLIGIAIGSHGITDSSIGVSIDSPHFPSWGRGAKIAEPLALLLGMDVPIFVDNQIRFQLFAEGLKGFAAGKSNVVVIEAGVGLVSAVMVDGEVKRGEHYLAGEIGHMIINPAEELRCACGGRGCFEVMVSRKRILGRSGAGSLQELFDAANSGESVAREVVDEAAGWFAIGVSNIALMYDPEIILIQGDYAGGGPFFMERLREKADKVSLLGLHKGIEIEYSSLGRERGVVGAACYIIEDYFKNMEGWESPGIESDARAR